MSDLVKQVEEASRGKFTGWGLVELAGFFVGAANPPLGLAMFVGAMVAEVSAQNQNLNETRMPDSWLQEVADSTAVSKKGMAYLAKCVQKNGFVSAKQAVKWVEIERQNAIELQQHSDKTSGLTSPGAVSLLTRARKECSGYLDVASLTKAIDSLSSMEKLAGLATDASKIVAKAASMLKK